MTSPGPVVAVVAAFDRADTVGATVAALLATGRVDRVVVVDDGSRDGTSAAAVEAGADVVRLPRNRGKGGALTTGIRAARDAGTYLLVDADLGVSAEAAVRLLPPVVAGDAGMAVAVLPRAGASGGFGVVRRIAGWGIARATGWWPRAPLSGQRAVDGATLRSLLPLAAGFGLETGVGIDAVRAGARVVEVDLPLEHRQTGRGPAGFAHRGRQGRDVLRALAGRLGGRWLRWGAAVGAGALAVGAVAGLAAWRTPEVAAFGGRRAPVLVFGVPGLEWDDVTAGRMPTLRRLVARGAAASVVVGADGGARGVADGYATLGAGAPAERGPARPQAAAVGGDALARQSGTREEAAIAVVAAPGAQRATRAAAHRRWVVTTAVPGSLGEALHRAGLRTGAVGVPATALAVMDLGGWVDVGTLAQEGPPVPGGPVVTAHVDPASFAAQVAGALEHAAVVVADPGEIERADALGQLSEPAGAADLHRRGVALTDAVLARVMGVLPPGTVLVVVASRPGPTPRPLVIAGAGAAGAAGRGRIELSGPGPRRQLTLTDVTATVARVAGAALPAGVTGRVLGVAVRPGTGGTGGTGGGLLAALGRS
ncbi:MAG TPA: glycosyltransferase, partial [Acidimicrobiales bacterium]|nr:glycosyltransferase [Acidimicrobiales bacterium]